MAKISDVHFRPDIQGLRAIAVLAVTLFHFDMPGLTGGYVGVDIFFVISGYLITGMMVRHLAEGRFSWIDFYKRRIRRILPASLTTIVLTLLAGAVIFPPELFLDLGHSAVWSTLFGANIHFSGASGYFDPGALEMPLLHFWSLAVEEQFYLVWPAVVLGLTLLLGARRFPLALIVLTVIAVALSEFWLRRNADGAYYLALPRAFEFLMGASVLAFEPAARKFPRVVIDAVFVAALVVLIGLCFVYTELTAFPGFAALPVVIATAAVILAGERTRFAALLANSFAQFVGRISYSMYLVHWPIVVFYKYVTGTELAVLDQVILLLVTFALGWLMWLGVEEPFRRRGSVSTPQWVVSRPNLAVAALFVIALGASFAVARTGGMTWRLDEDTRALYAQYLDGKRPPAACPDRTDLPRQFNCSYGDLTRPDADLLIIGDSHSIRLRVPMGSLLKDAGLRGMSSTTTGCVPLYDTGVLHDSQPNWYKFCRTKERVPFNFAVENHTPAVLLAGRWNLYTSGTRLGEMGSRAQVYLGTSADDIRSAERSMTVFPYRVRATLKRLTDGGTRVILLGQVPNLGYHPVRCLFSPLEGLLPGCEARSRDLVDEDNAFVTRVFKQMEREFPGMVLFIDPTDVFCRADTCSYQLDGEFLYSDSNHVSRFGAEHVIAASKDEMTRFLAAAQIDTPNR